MHILSRVLLGFFLVAAIGFGILGIYDLDFLLMMVAVLFSIAAGLLALEDYRHGNNPFQS